jgi:hypothetical protein
MAARRPDDELKRASEEQISREEDARALASGEKSRAQRRATVTIVVGVFG